MPIPATKKSVVMIGTFDGVHLAHQKMAQKTAALAKKLNATSCALSFSTPPRQFFKPFSGPILLSVAIEKKILLRQSGIKKVKLLTFNKTIAKLSPETFFKRYLLKQMNACAVVVGYNFRFGKNQEGTPQTLKTLGKKYNVQIFVIKQVKDNEGKTISSGRIRQNLLNNELDVANQLLGRAYFVQGKVIEGKKLGRQLQFATANVKPSEQKILPRGVFAAQVQLRQASKFYQGMCNIGVRPSVNKKKDLLVEVHLFNFNKNLYGKIIKIYLKKHLRAEKKFRSLSALQHQLKKDKLKTKEFFAQTP